MVLQNSCKATLLAEFDSLTSSDSRHVKLLEGQNQCLEEAWKAKAKETSNGDMQISSCFFGVPLKRVGIY